MITRIRLKNWKSHLDSELSFSKGVNALIGIMGSGKTSVMQGIAFALFGTFSALSSRKLSLDDLIMKKPQEKEEASVEIEFVVNGKRYMVKRTIRKGKGTVSAEIREGDKLLEVNPQGVTREVERILQMDYDLFQKAVYSEQNSLEYFLQIPKGKRMQQIDSMLKLDRYEKAREAAVKIRNSISAMRQQRLGDIERLKERKFDERIKQVEEEVKRREKEEGRIKEEYKKFEEKVESAEKKFERKREEIAKLRNEVAELNGRIIALERENKNLREEIEKKGEVGKKLGELKKLLGEKPEGVLKAKEEMLEKRRKELYSLETLKSEISRSLEELEEAGEKCPVCESPITREKKRELTEHKRKHIGEIEVKMKKLSELIAKDESEVGKLREKIEFLKDMRREVEETKGYEKKIAKNEREIKTKRKEVEKLAEEIKEREMEERKFRKEVQEVIGRARELKAKLESLRELIRDKREMLNELKKERDMFLKYVEEAKRYERIIEAMDRFVAVLKSTQDQLRSEFLKTVNHIMDQIWGELYPYGDFSEIRMVVENDYILQLKGTRGWVNVDVVSGGERSLACLALRIAFSLAFTPNLRWLILDEPTHNLDANAIEHFGLVLRDRMENIIDQVFLITHEERLSDYITGSVYKLERDKELDGVTRVKGI